MTAGETPARLRLSILERLTDEAPDQRLDPPRNRAYDLRLLKEAVRRDLSALLNTKRRETEIPSHFPECENSLLNFGIPDFTSLSIKDPSEQHRLRRAIEAAVRKFEPRLSSVAVSLAPQPANDPALRFRIDALLHIEPRPEPVFFSTLLRGDTSEIIVTGEGE